MSDPNISRSLPMNAAAVRLIQQEVARENAIQVESEADLNQYFETAAFNPMQRASNFKELHELRNTQTQKKEKANDLEEPEIAQIEAVEEAADRYQNANYELNKKTLLILKQMIKEDDSPEEILKKVQDIYADPTLADGALDFLIETADPNLQANLKTAKEMLNQQAGREITAGKNINKWAQDFSTKGLGSPTSLRDMYRDITGTAREPIVLFSELTDKFPYDKLQGAINFLLHSLGQDLRAKGSSIPHGELKRLVDEVRSLQGILGVFRFFKSRVPIMSQLFASNNITPPKGLTFETIAKAFIKLLTEKYINPEKIMQSSKGFGLEKKWLELFIVLNQMREALKQISPKYYRTPTHRDEVLKAYLGVLDQIEEKYEDEKEEEEEKKKREEEKEKND